MLIFHEGLPGSGKSYAALIDHIIPALQKGRHVFAYIEGLDFDRIAEAAGLEVDRVRELLHPLTREQVPTIPGHVLNDSLVVIDELQNFFPSGRQKLSPEITQFVTEHRHRGLDVLCMGQVLNDCHALWKGRIDTKIVFRKLDAIGKADQYRWSVCKNVNGKFKETTTGKGTYDPKYFGCYASHTDDTSNTETYADARANVWNSKAWRMMKWYGGGLLIALVFIVWFFNTGGGMAQAQAKKPESKPKVDPNEIAARENAKAQAAQAEKAEKASARTDVFSGAPADYVDDLAGKGRIRLGGTVKSSTRVSGFVEWRDGSNRLVERFTFAELNGLGWYVMVSADGGMATISRPGKTYVATQWPMADDRAKSPEKVPEVQQTIIKNETLAPPPAHSTPKGEQVAVAQGSSIPKGAGQ